MKKLLLAAILSLLPSFAFAQASFTFKDAAGATQTVKSFNCTPICPMATLADTTGASIYGTAGMANANVITIQGIASGTVVPVSLASTTITGTAAVTSIDGGIVTIGSKADAASCTGSQTQVSCLKQLDADILTRGTSANQTSQITQETAINTVLGTTGTAASCAAGSSSTAIACQYAIYAAVSGPIPAGTANIGNVGQISQYPNGATAITASATGTTGATTATLAGTLGKTTYICGYSIRANATAATTVTDTVTGVITATMSSILWVAPLASGIGVDEQIFSPCIPASGQNTGIAIVSGAPGAGGTVSSKGWGFQL